VRGRSGPKPSGGLIRPEGRPTLTPRGFRGVSAVRLYSPTLFPPRTRTPTVRRARFGRLKGTSSARIFITREKTDGII